MKTFFFWKKESPPTNPTFLCKVTFSIFWVFIPSFRSSHRQERKNPLFFLSSTFPPVFFFITFSNSIAVVLLSASLHVPLIYVVCLQFSHFSLLGSSIHPQFSFHFSFDCSTIWTQTLSFSASILYRIFVHFVSSKYFLFILHCISFP